MQLPHSRICAARRGGALTRIAIALGVLALLALGFLLALDRIAAASIERAGKWALGVDTALGSANIGLWSGQFELRELQVANPPGFTSPHFLELRSGALALPLARVLSDSVVVERLELEGVRLVLEQREGKLNSREILANVKGLAKEEQGKPKQEPAGEGKAYALRRVVVRDIDVSFDLLPPLPARALRIDRIEIEDVGTESSMVDLAGVVARITAAIVAAALEQSGDLVPPEWRQEIEGALGALEWSEEGLLKKLGAGLGNTGEAIQQGAIDLKDKVKGLFDDTQKKDGQK